MLASCGVETCSTLMFFLYIFRNCAELRHSKSQRELRFPTASGERCVITGASIVRVFSLSCYSVHSDVFIERGLIAEAPAKALSLR